MGNIFEILNPETCYCVIQGYLKHHSYMEIRVARENIESSEGVLYLHFEGVVYFEGPMIWQGAAFSLAPSSACLSLLHKTAKYEGVPDDYLSQRFQLITTTAITPKLDKLEIAILTQARSITSEPSPYFLTG
jgi:hypothetical protein